VTTNSTSSPSGRLDYKPICILPSGMMQHRPTLPSVTFTVLKLHVIRTEAALLLLAKMTFRCHHIRSAPGSIRQRLSFSWFTLRRCVHHWPLALIYRPPGGSIPAFYNELSDVLCEIAATCTDRLLVCGDLNCPGSNATSVDSGLAALLEEHGLAQHVHGATKSNPDHLLDIIATEPWLPVSGVRVENVGGVSDHSLVVASIAAALKPLSLIDYTYRNVRDIDPVDFENRLRRSSLYTSPASTTNAFAEQFRSVVTEVLDVVAPARRSRRRRSKPETRWLSRDAVKAKRMRRRLERKWIRTRLESDRNAYRAACRRAKYTHKPITI
jgi:hypothetical protein